MAGITFSFSVKTLTSLMRGKGKSHAANLQSLPEFHTAPSAWASRSRSNIRIEPALRTCYFFYLPCPGGGMADAEDLKSSGVLPHVGSTPTPGTILPDHIALAGLLRRAASRFVFLSALSNTRQTRVFPRSNLIQHATVGIEQLRCAGGADENTSIASKRLMDVRTRGTSGLTLPTFWSPVAPR
jgi:hypothetical protein